MPGNSIITIVKSRAQERHQVPPNIKGDAESMDQQQRPSTPHDPITKGYLAHTLSHHTPVHSGRIVIRSRRIFSFISSPKKKPAASPATSGDSKR